MNPSSQKMEATNRIYSMQKFIKRVICTLSILIFITITVIFFIMYLPFKQELEKSLMTNFNQVSYIRYAAELPPFFVPITMLVRNLSLSGNRSGA